MVEQPEYTEADRRVSAIITGVVSIILITTVFCLLVCMDVRTLNEAKEKKMVPKHRRKGRHPDNPNATTASRIAAEDEPKQGPSQEDVWLFVWELFHIKKCL